MHHSFLNAYSQYIHGNMKELVVVLANEGGIVLILGMNCF